jgi:hypothetical protein
VALTYPSWREAYRQALPDYTPDDVVGSPYAIWDYQVDPALGEERRIVAVNLSDQPAQFFLSVDMPQLAGEDWLLCDLLNDKDYVRSGDDTLRHGLVQDPAAHGAHIFDVRRN